MQVTEHPVLRTVYQAPRGQRCRHTLNLQVSLRIPVRLVAFVVHVAQQRLRRVAGEDPDVRRHHGQVLALIVEAQPVADLQPSVWPASADTKTERPDLQRILAEAVADQQMIGLVDVCLHSDSVADRRIEKPLDGSRELASEPGQSGHYRGRTPMASP